MTKAEIVSKISDKLGLDRNDVQLTVENFMDEVINSLESGQNVYLHKKRYRPHIFPYVIYIFIFF